SSVPPANSGEWTWMSGSNTGGAIGSYGNLGTPTATNVPGARVEASGWTDSSGNFWLFGGDGLDSAGMEGLLNDLWEFDTSTNTWTWVSGSNLKDQFGSYGTQGVTSTTN